MAKTKQWLTAKGETVPADIVSAHDKRKEKAVMRIVKCAEKAHEALKDLKATASAETDKVYAEHLRIRGVETGASKGNYTMYNFDKSVKVEINNSDSISFDDGIETVKQLLDKYIEDVTNEASSEIRMLIQGAFKTRKGQLDKARLFSLFQYHIEHPIWMQAMDALKASIDVQSSKKYMKISKRNENGEYVNIPLSLSAV